MALGDPYITASELKLRLGITDTEDDVRIQGAVDSATRSINEATSRDFQKTTTATARAYWPLISQLVLTHDFHTTAGLVVKIDNDDDGTYETTIAAADYVTEPVDGIVGSMTGWPFWRIRLVNGDRFPRTRRPTVQVTAQWGWTSVPVNIKEATYVLAEDLFKLRDTPFGVGGFAEFGRIRARENPNVAMLIDYYRRNKVRAG